MLARPSTSMNQRACASRRRFESSSRNAVSVSSACTTKRFVSSRCASAIQIVRPPCNQRLTPSPNSIRFSSDCRRLFLSTSRSNCFTANSEPVAPICSVHVGRSPPVQSPIAVLDVMKQCLSSYSVVIQTASMKAEIDCKLQSNSSRHQTHQRNN